MRRRDFLAVVGGAVAAWQLTARAQQQPAMPVIGVLLPGSPDPTAQRLSGFLRGLKDGGYLAGETVTLEYRWAENQMDRLPALAADLVGRRVSVIVDSRTIVAYAAKAATTTIPIVFAVNDDPVRLGLSCKPRAAGRQRDGRQFLNRRGGCQTPRAPAQELVPKATRVAVLVNPANAIEHRCPRCET